MTTEANTDPGLDPDGKRRHSPWPLLVGAVSLALLALSFVGSKPPTESVSSSAESDAGWVLAPGARVALPLAELLPGAPRVRLRLQCEHEGCADLRILRELAKRYAEAAAHEKYDERRDLWRRHNALERTRPPIYVRWTAAWWNTGTDLAVNECEDPFYAQIGYMFPQDWELALRYATVDPNDDVDHDDEDELMIGFNKFFMGVGHSLKLSVDAAWMGEETGAGSSYDDFRVRVQGQIVF